MTGRPQVADSAWEDTADAQRRIVAEIAEQVRTAVQHLAKGEQSGLETLERLRSESAARLGADHRQTLRVHAAAASWRGELGDAESARNVLAALHAHACRVLGETDADTLLIAANTAAFTGIAGDARSAASMLERLLPEVERCFGVPSAAADTVRANLSVWRSRSGTPGEENATNRDEAAGRDSSADAPAI
jgi:hypothetical protein